MRSFRLLAVVTLGLGCTDAAGPSLAGPPFVTAIINGIPWTVRAADHAFGQLTPESTLVVVGMAIEAPDIYQALGFQVGHVRATGTYTLSSSGDPGPINEGYYERHSGPGVQTYATGEGNTGQVEITGIDPVEHIVVGTFSFTALLRGGTAVVRVRQGSFRVNYP